MAFVADRVRERRTQPLSKKEVDDDKAEIIDYVDLNQLPKFSDLRQEVQKVIDSSSWFEQYGIDAIIHSLGILGWFLSHFLLASPRLPVFIAGILLLGYCHYVLSFKGGHCAIHNALCKSKTVNQVMGYFFSDFFGSFSSDVAYDAHIKCHHPHTNIFGLGDSSVWRATFASRYVYMFVVPLLLPVITPIISMKECFELGFGKFLRHLFFLIGGYYLHFYLLSTISDLSFTSSLFVVFLSRNLLTIPYIHVNIFQHIGLPMYSQKSRPRRIYQMLTGVLNLPRNPILDWCFGHGIMNGHVEHHLFPGLSDNMCLKIKPVVSQFCQDNDLPYHYDTYLNRTNFFLQEYQSLMVDLPPITSFVGLQ